MADSPIVSSDLDTNPMRASDASYAQGYKNMAWLDLTMSQRNKPADADTTILVDVDGNVTEGPGFNVGIVKNKVIYTADKNVLKGITMTVVEDIAKNKGMMFCRLPISQQDFNNADEVFITSSSGGVTATQKSGPVTQELMVEYEHMKETYATDLN